MRSKRTTMARVASEFKDAIDSLATELQRPVEFPWQKRPTFPDITRQLASKKDKLRELLK